MKKQLKILCKPSEVQGRHSNLDHWKPFRKWLLMIQKHVFGSKKAISEMASSDPNFLSTSTSLFSNGIAEVRPSPIHGLGI
jgi:hypothetical protein